MSRLATVFRPIATALFMLACSPAYADDARDPPQVETRIGQVLAENGTVIVKAYKELGSVVSVNGRKVTLFAISVTGMKSGVTERGVSLELAESEHRVKSAFIDADEIMDVVKGLDYITHVDPASLPFSDYIASYSTKGGLLLSAMNSESGLVTRLEVGNGTTASMLLLPPMVSNLRHLLTTAHSTFTSGR